MKCRIFNCTEQADFLIQTRQNRFHYCTAHLKTVKLFSTNPAISLIGVAS